MNEEYILKVIDLFQANNKRFYLVTKYANKGNLSDHIKSFMKEEDLLYFLERSVVILKYLHYDLLEKYKTKQKA